jgi:beta-lactam-binding protein with PASTA domain
VSKIVQLASVALSAIALPVAAFGGTTPIATASSITIPDLTGQNAKIAEDKLEALGLTNVTLSSATTKYTMVLAPENWKVVSIEPTPGSAVSSNDDVILKVTKP